MGEDSVTAAPRRPRWKRALTASVLLVAGAAAAIVWWGRPQLGEGGLIAAGDGMTWANDGVANTRMLVKGKPVDTVTATFSIRNSGRLPFTVHGLDAADSDDWLSRQQVTFIAGHPGEDANATPRQQVTLGPGDEATVFWSLDMHCRPPLAEGVRGELDALRFRVSWWGFPASRALELEQPITFVGDDVPAPQPGPECRT
ncbi:hypothetical protein [Actinoplanes flavus]|uniref:Uncharacterized protein n=1 Tax=Actinoplanes flavus TaxID=2820290 RepID=A0ABS3ULA5_9ACTN|nr:hypothetical protein [Actinoplanes flavus]MBO3739521.1 hypothetical protein [Actinoplanes flavus]